MSNTGIRKAMTDASVKQWEVAERIGMNESSLSRRMRHELPEDLRDRILNAIDAIKADRSGSAE